MSICRSHLGDDLKNQVSRPISTGQLHMLPCFHLRPIKQVIFLRPLGDHKVREITLGAGFPLRCFQRLSVPDVATRQCSWRNNRITRGLSTPVLSY